MSKYFTLTSSKWEFNDEGDPEDREWYIPYKRRCKSYDEALSLAKEDDPPDWKIHEIVFTKRLIAQDEGF